MYGFECDPKIVVIGGGTGIPCILRGLKKYTKNITAIVTVADDGGGSGVLRDELKMLPPGDIRNCLIALANTEPIMKELLKYRFTEGNLKNQNFGNLFIAAMVGITHSFEEAIKKVSDVLAITGKVLPVTNEHVTLKAKLLNGVLVSGESNIPKESQKHNSPIKEIYIDPENSRALSSCIDSIIDSDCIILGPGSLYTSILPNLKVKGISEAINKNNGKLIYVSNIMTQYGETTNYNLIDHIDSIFNNTDINKLHYVISNNSDIPYSYIEKYRDENSELVDSSMINDSYKGINIIKDDLIKFENGFIRHDEDKISKIIMDIIR